MNENITCGYYISEDDDKKKAFAAFLENYFMYDFIFRKVSEKSVIYCTTCFVDTKKRHKFVTNRSHHVTKYIIFSFFGSEE